MVDAELALLGTAFVATCDEWHQRFLPNRMSSPLDVLLDCCGAVAMLWFVFLYARLFGAGTGAPNLTAEARCKRNRFT
jgi:VanZ family protein